MRRVLLRMIQVYSDQPGACLGREVAGGLRRELGGGFQVVESVWRTELLRDAALRIQAAEEARGCHVVMVAAPERGGMPDGLGDWLELWRDRDGEVPGAFVALLHAESGGEGGSIVPVLHAHAREACMEFFCHAAATRRSAPLFPWGSWRERRWEGAPVGVC